MTLQSPESTRDAILAILEVVPALTIFRGVLNNSPGQAVLTLFRALVVPEPEALAIVEAYSDAFSKLALAANNDTSRIPDAWQSYLANAIINDINVLNTQAEVYGVAAVGAGLQAQAQHEMKILFELFTLSAQQVWELMNVVVARSNPILKDTSVPWYNLSAKTAAGTDVARDRLLQEIATKKDWGGLSNTLLHFWAQYGTGMFARYPVLRWDGHAKVLQGVSHPDPVQLSDLIDYEQEKRRLQTNIEHFLQGVPAHDAILYGAPGTGKSSTVKALANTYANEGLRLIEVRKEWVDDLPVIVNEVRNHAPHFLLFIDDLSFEEHETSYKALKVFLEGTVEMRPANVLIYATTNRLNLIRENFADRGKPNEDVHWRDTLDEKASLVARFGLRVTFLTPDQTQYMNIVLGLARQRGLALQEEDLRRRALAWERQHTGRSGRLARQFVDELEAESRR